VDGRNYAGIVRSRNFNNWIADTQLLHAVLHRVTPLFFIPGNVQSRIAIAICGYGNIGFNSRDGLYEFFDALYRKAAMQ